MSNTGYRTDVRDIAQLSFVRRGIWIVIDDDSVRYRLTLDSADFIDLHGECGFEHVISNFQACLRFAPFRTFILLNISHNGNQMPMSQLTCERLPDNHVLFSSSSVVSASCAATQAGSPVVSKKSRHRLRVLSCHPAAKDASL